MRNSVKEELLKYAKEAIQDRDLSINDDDLHHLLFNEDYYIIGYYQASEWLKSHDIGEFESIELLNKLYLDHFGEIQDYSVNSESVVNHLVYCWGLEIIGELQNEEE